jgi:hypothetical protein
MSRKITVTVNLFGTIASATYELPFEPTDADIEYIDAIFKQKMLERFEADAQKLLMEGSA